MTTVVAPITGGDETPVAAQTGDRALKWAIRAGWALLSVQLGLMIAFNVVEKNRFGLTVDHASYYQAWYLISHGHFDAYSSTLRFSFWKNNGEFLTWPLAILSRPILSQTSFLVISDLAVVGTSVVGLLWIQDVVRRPTWPGRFPAWIPVATFVLLTCLNPWLYDSIAMAWHLEPIQILILMLAAYSLERRQWKRAAIFVALAMLGGTTSAALLAGLGFGTFLAGRRWRRAGLAIFAAGALTLLVLGSLHLQGGNVGNIYGYVLQSGRVGHTTTAAYRSVTISKILKAAIEHPDRVLKTVWFNRINIYANLAPSGFIGLLSPWGLGAPLASLIETQTTPGVYLSLPTFQNLATFQFVTLGTILVLRRIALLGRRGPYLAMVGSGVLVINAVLWAIVWLPMEPNEWVRVSRPAAAVLNRAAHVIPADAEVVASTGVVGNFAQRPWVYYVELNLAYPVKARSVYFVVTPNQGIEAADVSDSLATVAYLADDLHATPVAIGAGVYVFRWHPPKGVKTFGLLPDRNALPAWTVPGPAGAVIRTGTARDWFVGSTGRKGYVVAGDYWRRPSGRYQAQVNLSANVPVNVEIWNQTTDKLLARRSILPTDGRENVDFDASFRAVAVQGVSGSGLFKITPIEPVKGNTIEIRVWSDGSGAVSVYNLGLRRI